MSNVADTSQAHQFCYRELWNSDRDRNELVVGLTREHDL